MDTSSSSQPAITSTTTTTLFTHSTHRVNSPPNQRATCRKTSSGWLVKASRMNWMRYSHRFAGRTSARRRPAPVYAMGLSCLALLLLLAASSSFIGPVSGADTPAAPETQSSPQQSTTKSTAPTLERQVDTPNSAPVPVSSPPKAPITDVAAPSSTPSKTRAVEQQNRKQADQIQSSRSQASKQQQQQQRKSLHQNNQDKYQLKGTHSSQPETAPEQQASSTAADRDTREQLKTGSEDKDVGHKSSQKKSSSSASGASSGNGKSSVFSRSSPGSSSGAGGAFAALRRMLPSFMSAAPMAVAALSSAAAADRHQVSHSRSAQANGGETLLTKASGKLVNLLSAKKSASETPFFIAAKPAIDRQSGFASGLLSNPLGLGLLFSAPLIPSLLLTPLAIAGLSPAMSAINNFFGDDDDAASPSSTPGPLSSVLGGSSALSSLLQASGSSSSSSSSSSPSLAVQALHSILGQPSSTEKPLFNPGMFAGRNIQTALSSAVSQASGGSGAASSSGGSQAGASSGGPLRSLLGGSSLMQTAASMISPSFAAPPASGSSAAATGAGGGSAAAASEAAEADEPSLIQMAFDKVANYMSAERDLSQAAGSGKPVPQQSSPLLGGFSPFQLSSLLAASPLAAAFAPAGSSSSSSSASNGAASSAGPASQQRAGFFSTLKNVYELFSSSFLRRQEEENNSSGCHERLICEIHQKAMNSKLFKRSLQSELKELSNLDKILLDQIKSGSLDARVDSNAKLFLTDFLKASNDFRSGHEMVDCSKLYPKCSRSMLFSVAKAQFNEATGGGGGGVGLATNVAEGKFATLIKKMKFKPAHHRKSKKPAKAVQSTAVNLLSRPPAVAATSQPGFAASPLDYMQQQASMQQQQVLPGPLSPDNLKMVQHLLMMSGNQQQQQQYAAGRQQPAVVQYPNFAPYTSVISNQPSTAVQGYYPASSPQDSIALMYTNPTESPFFSGGGGGGGSFPSAQDIQSTMMHAGQMSRQAQPMQQQEQQQQAIAGLNDYQFSQQASSTSLKPEQQPQQVQQQQQMQLPQQQQLLPTGSADKALNQQVTAPQTKPLANAA